MASIIKIDDLHRMYGSREFELFIKDRKEVTFKGGKEYKLSIVLDNKTYDIWEPKNKVWQSFSPQVGMGLVCRIVDATYKFIEPIQQLLVINDSTNVLDLHDLPYEDGVVLTLAVGLVSSKNKTQYVLLYDGSAISLIRVPTNWEVEYLQYTAVKTTYKRTTKKGFLSEPVVVHTLDTDTIDVLLKN